MAGGVGRTAREGDTREPGPGGGWGGDGGAWTAHRCASSSLTLFFIQLSVAKRGNMRAGLGGGGLSQSIEPLAQGLHVLQRHPI